MASLKGQRALGPMAMRIDGTAVFLKDKIVLGAAPGLGTPAAADTLDVLLLPAGTELCTLESVNDDMDTGTTLEYGIGYRPVDGSNPAASLQYFAANATTAFRAAGRVEYTFKPIKFDYDVWVCVTIGTAPAGISGNPELHFIAGVNQVGPK